VKRALTAALFASLAACNSAPSDTCTPYTHALSGAATPPASCDGVCTSLALTDAGADGATFELCTVDCTDAGQAACPSGTTCVSAEPVTTGSYCLFTCGDDAGCPQGLFCFDGGLCL